MIELTGIKKFYKTGNVITNALNEIDLAIDKGSFTSIIGQSGSGKTTLLNIIGLLESADSGEYIFNGKQMNSLNDREKSSVRNKNIGMIFQNYNLLPELTIYENVVLPMTFSDFPKDERQKRAKEALEIVGLYTRKEHRPFQLSGGQQQRVSIARAIASTPDVLVADEPTGNLDSKMSEQIMEIIQSINENGTTVIMVTHNDTHADLAQNKIHILDGEIQEIIRK